MFLKPAVNETRFLVASTILLLAMPSAGLSQNNSSPVTSDEAIDTLDEIVVYGAPTLRLLRDEVYEAEEDFYGLFNALNQGRQFDIKCFYQSRVGSHIRRRICEPYFVKNPPIGGAIGGRGPPLWAYIRHKTKQMNQEIVALVDKHPELHAALMQFADAKQSFNSSFLARCDNRFAICQK